VQRFKSASACALMAFAWSTRPCAVCSNRAAAYPGVLCLAPYAARVRLDVAGLRLRVSHPLLLLDLPKDRGVFARGPERIAEGRGVVTDRRCGRLDRGLSAFHGRLVAADRSRRRC